VEHPEDLVDDATSLLDYLYDPYVDLNRSDFNSHPSAINEAAPAFDPFYALIANEVPFYVLGMSMGGGTALQLGLNLQLQKHAYAHLFQGCILLAPAIETKLPSALTTMVFENLMVPFFPDACMPASVGGKDHEAVWDSAHFIEYVAVKDHYDPENNPHGMSFNNPIRYRTASSILKLMGGVMQNLDAVAFPFVVFHDPDDNVTMYSGSTLLLERSATAAHQKRLVSMPNGRHDLIINRLAFIVDETFAWIESHGNCIRDCSSSSACSSVATGVPSISRGNGRRAGVTKAASPTSGADSVPLPSRVRIRRAK